MIVNHGIMVDVKYCAARVPGNSPLPDRLTLQFYILNCRQLAPPSVHQERVIFFGVRKSLFRLVRLLAAVRADSRKTRQKQHLYIENYNSGPTMQTSTSLSFFTQIFVAFSGALAEELMIFCRHVRTELSNY